MFEISDAAPYPLCDGQSRARVSPDAVRAWPCPLYGRMASKSQQGKRDPSRAAWGPRGAVGVLPNRHPGPVGALFRAPKRAGNIRGAGHLELFGLSPLLFAVGGARLAGVGDAPGGAIE